ncbi:hypothetical protein CAPTEDRAFT_223767 [Capitella teleta]|uniref:Sushi, von Willebrand factor type A, EGF and pentraxin domain-containing protein 1 n=1 Tax=Capitella teleta TaxID=283909 RepID=R7TG91_CAPTE|nr:hypothetical protein CAPTEDRAFT_223767 [Capitella teleta]|eukprot:ELT92507.1 hypothetical protein CAPTEDRAFT_223767 [Capitella teleta]
MALVKVEQVSGGPYVDDPECPRKPSMVHGRKCLKKCQTDSDCKGKNKQCLCDDVCGRSCVKPTLRCETLKPVFNGNFEIDTFNTFGAKVRYTCNEGYILSGLAERICQGDGFWSARAPTCETEGKCRNPPIVPHTTHDGPTGQTVFPLGTQLTYSCRAGYTSEGFYKAMCVGEGRWVSPRIRCSARRCGHPGDIAHGHRHGNSFAFPERVTYNCSEGYRLLGRPFRVCQADGTWSNTLPTCRPVKCPRISNIANGMVDGKDYTYGAHVHFSCHTGFTLIGSHARICRQDGKWSGQEAVCAMVDCGLPVPFYNGFLDGQQTTYGATIRFICFGRTSFDGESRSTTCQDNGTWSYPAPKCWSQCQVPPIHNGTVTGFVIGKYADHGNELHVKCDEGHENETSSAPLCYNGTWEYLPKCIPESCKTRPRVIPNARLRFYTSFHNDKAVYRCNPGYKLEGDSSLVCQYGKWQGRRPICLPVYCEYPGTINNGDVLLVGRIGKYEYRSYVKGTGHNEVIEFHCHKGYKRSGPAASTCVNGDWSPANKPVCVPKQHPNLLPVFMYRSRRSSAHGQVYESGQCPHPGRFRNGKIHKHAADGRRIRYTRKQGPTSAETNITFTCKTGFTRSGTEAAVCRDGSWRPSGLPQCVRDEHALCKYPGTIDNGRVMLVGVHGKFEYRHYVKDIGQNTTIEYQCFDGFELNGTRTSLCNHGRWTPERKPTCSIPSQQTDVTNRPT